MAVYIFLSLSALFACASSATVYVSFTSGVASDVVGCGQSAGAPCKTLGAGLREAASGDTLSVVGGGTSRACGAHIDKAIAIRASPTATLDCNGTATGLYVDGGANAVELDGLSFLNGRAGFEGMPDQDDTNVAGALNVNVTGLRALTVRNSLFRGNHANGFRAGGAILFAGSLSDGPFDLTINDTSFVDNTANSTMLACGAVLVTVSDIRGGTFLFSGLTITNNYALTVALPGGSFTGAAAGGGVVANFETGYSEDVRQVYLNTVVRNNTGIVYGGEGSDFSGNIGAGGVAVNWNTALSQGNGIHLRNCTLSDNYHWCDGRGINFAGTAGAGGLLVNHNGRAEQLVVDIVGCLVDSNECHVFGDADGYSGNAGSGGILINYNSFGGGSVHTCLNSTFHRNFGELGGVGGYLSANGGSGALGFYYISSQSLGNQHIVLNTTFDGNTGVVRGTKLCAGAGGLSIFFYLRPYGEGNSLLLRNCRFHANIGRNEALSSNGMASAVAIASYGAPVSNGTFVITETKFVGNFVSGRNNDYEGTVAMLIFSGGNNNRMFLTDNTHEDNASGSGGGGATLVTKYGDGNAFELLRESFARNSAGGSGGAIVVSPFFMVRATDCTYENNTASNDGGAAVLSSPNATFSNCVFAGNRARVSGGALSLAPMSLTQVHGCTFARNTASTGGAISASKESVLMGYRNAFTMNKASSASEVFFGGSSMAGLTYSVFEAVGSTSVIFAGGGAALATVSYMSSGNQMLCPRGFEFVATDEGNIVGCSECPPGTYLLTGGTNRNLAKCKSCGSLVGSDCSAGGADPRTTSGFWADISGTEDPTLEFVQCPHGYCCHDEEEGCELQYCVTGRTGRLCGSCLDGRAEVLGSTVCQENGHCDDAAWFLPLVIFLVLVYSIVLLRHPHGHSSPFKIIVLHFQLVPLVTSYVGFAADVGIVTTVDNVFSLSLELFGVHNGICIVKNMTAQEKIATGVILPLFLLAELCLCRLALLAYRRFREESSTTRSGIVRVKKGSASFASAVTTVVLISYDTCLKTIFNLLSCVEIGGKKYLFRAADSAQCYAGWQVALFFGLALVLAIPACIVFLQRRYSRQVARGDTVSPALCQLVHVTEAAYSKRWRHWEAVLLYWRVGLVFFDVFIPNRLWRSMAVCMGLLLLFAVNIALHPFGSAEGHHLECASLAILVVMSVLNVRTGLLDNLGISARSELQLGTTHVYDFIELALLVLPVAYITYKAIEYIYHVVKSTQKRKSLRIWPTYYQSGASLGASHLAKSMMLGMDESAVGFMLTPDMHGYNPRRSSTQAPSLAPIEDIDVEPESERAIDKLTDAAPSPSPSVGDKRAVEGVAECSAVSPMNANDSMSPFGGVGEVAVVPKRGATREEPSLPSSPDGQSERSEDAVPATNSTHVDE